MYNRTVRKQVMLLNALDLGNVLIIHLLKDKEIIFPCSYNLKQSIHPLNFIFVWSIATLVPPQCSSPSAPVYQIKVLTIIWYIVSNQMHFEVI